MARPRGKISPMKPWPNRLQKHKEITIHWRCSKISPNLPSQQTIWSQNLFLFLLMLVVMNCLPKRQSSQKIICTEVSSYTLDYVSKTNIFLIFLLHGNLAKMTCQRVRLHFYCILAYFDVFLLDTCFIFSIELLYLVTWHIVTTNQASVVNEIENYYATPHVSWT